jgi:hypothetical protein
MSARGVERALARLCAPGAVLAPERAGMSFGLYPNGDRRRRPIVRLSAAEVGELGSSGAIAAAGEGFAITDAGRARARREGARSDEAFTAQHGPIVDRAVMDGDGAARTVRGFEIDGVIRRLAALRDASGVAWLTGAEIAAAARLRSDWERGEQGLVRGSDWRAPPKGGTARGFDGAAVAHCDARRRVAEALKRLAPPLRRIVERVCFHEEGLEALERAESWPARSGKLALKLALAQLAAG